MSTELEKLREKIIEGKLKRTFLRNQIVSLDNQRAIAENEIALLESKLSIWESMRDGA